MTALWFDDCVRMPRCEHCDGFVIINLGHKACPSCGRHWRFDYEAWAWLASTAPPPSNEELDEAHKAAARDVIRELEKLHRGRK